jgi:hypothetical protein
MPKTTPSDTPKRRASKASEDKRAMSRTARAVPTSRRKAHKPKALPAPQAPASLAASRKAPTKLAILLELLRRPGGVTLDEMTRATGWQAHSVRGAMAGALKRRGIAIDSAKADGVRRYRAAVDVTLPETA